MTSTSALLERISASLDSIDDLLSNNSRLLDSTLSHFEVIEGFFFERTSIQNKLLYLINSLGSVIASYTQDIEICLTQNRINQKLNVITLLPIDFEIGEERLVAHPIGRASLYFNKGSIFSLPDCLIIESKWIFQVASSEAKRITMLTSVMLKPIGDNSKYNMIINSATRWLNSRNEPYNPLSTIPRAEGKRSEARDIFESKIKEEISSIQIPIPQFNNQIITNGFHPHYYQTVNKGNRSYILFAAQTLSQHKTKEPLFSGLIYDANQLIRLKKEHIIPVIKQKMREKEVSLTNIDFRWGYIHIEVFKKHNDSCLHIDIEVKVWMHYSVRILEDLPGLLFADGHWSYWRYHYDIDWCFPVCSEVEKRVVEETEKRIDQNLHFTALFADLRDQAFRARTSIQPYGIEIYMQGY
ncbi:MAG: hypothetical protein AB2805_14290 [Candidatus Thiodiazotropha sp.]